MLPKQPYTVNYVLSHNQLHDDELLAHELAKRIKPDMFPGIESAPIVLMDAGLHPETGRDGDYYLASQKTLCLGVCGGQFDEHGQTDKESKSAASCMAAWLGLDQDPGLKPILEYSLKADRQARVTPFELPHLIKAWWAAGFQLEEVASMYQTIFFSLYRRFSGAPAKAQPQSGAFRYLVAEWFVWRFVEPLQQKKHSGRYANGEAAAVALGRGGDDTRPIVELDTREGRFAKTPFDLEGIWEAMVMAGISYAEQCRIVFASLDAKYFEQLEFLKARAEFQLKCRYVKEGPGHPYSVVVVESGSTYMNRATRWDDRDADVLVQILPDRRYRVFDLNKRLKGMDCIAAQLRMAERGSARLPRLTIDVLRSEGTLREVPQCFYWAEGHGVFNGTNTAPSTPVTKLTSAQVVTAVDRGLAFAWRRDHVLAIRRQREFVARLRDRKKAEQSADSAA